MALKEEAIGIKINREIAPKDFSQESKRPFHIDAFSLVIGLGRGFKSLISDLLYYLPGIDTLPNV